MELRQTYLSFRRFVDHWMAPEARDPDPFAGAWSQGTAWLLLLVPLLPTIALRDQPSLPGRFAFVIAAALSTLLAAFLAWRTMRMNRAYRLIHARRFERKVRYALPPEYSDSEDGELAWIRRRRR